MAAPPPPPPPGPPGVPSSNLPGQFQTVSFAEPEVDYSVTEDYYKRYFAALEGWNEHEAAYRAYVHAAHYQVGQMAQLAVGNHQSQVAAALALNNHWSQYNNWYNNWYRSFSSMYNMPQYPGRDMKPYGNNDDDQ